MHLCSNTATVRVATDVCCAGAANFSQLLRGVAMEMQLSVGLCCCWRLQDAMEADRKLREEQYAARRDKDWEETLRREAELHR